MMYNNKKSCRLKPYRNPKAHYLLQGILGVCLLLASAGVASAQAQGESDIYLVNVDGSELKKLTDDPLLESRPSWGPDGKRLVYSAFDDAGSSIYIHDLESGERHLLLEDGEDDYDPTWSPDGKTIVFSSRREGRLKLFSCDSDGKNLKLLSNAIVDPDGGYHYFPRFSPDGDTLVFCYRNLHYTKYYLYLYNISTKKLEPLSEPHRGYDCPSWSPDGRNLVCIRVMTLSEEESPFQQCPLFECVSIDLETEEKRTLDLYSWTKYNENGCAERLAVPTFSTSNNTYYLTMCLSYMDEQGTLYRIEESNNGEEFLAEKADLGPFSTLYGVVLAPQTDLAACNSSPDSFLSGRSWGHARRAELRTEFQKYGRAIAWLLLGPHGELFVPTKTMLGSMN